MSHNPNARLPGIRALGPYPKETNSYLAQCMNPDRLV